MTTSSPVAIGGVGGSGTRLIASILQDLGFYIGSDLNESVDNLLFTLLFKRAELWPLENNQHEIAKLINFFSTFMQGSNDLRTEETEYLKSLTASDRLQHKSEWLKERLNKLLNSETQIQTKWGWKEPNTHIFLPSLFEQIPNLKYIHVVRHGLDMAYSSNQNQLKLWGPKVLGPSLTQNTGEASFDYWCWAQRRMIDIGRQMGGQYLCINFEEFCSSAERGLFQLTEFLNICVPEKNINELATAIKLPSTVNRYIHNLNFKPNNSDIELLYSLGYDYSGS